MLSQQAWIQTEDKTISNVTTKGPVWRQYTKIRKSTKWVDLQPILGYNYPLDKPMSGSHFSSSIAYSCQTSSIFRMSE
jgi:hypothetical protein